MSKATLKILKMFLIETTILSFFADYEPKSLSMKLNAQMYAEIPHLKYERTPKIG